MVYVGDRMGAGTVLAYGDAREEMVIRESEFARVVMEDVTGPARVLELR